MKISNSKKILPILFGFFIVGFADVVGISTNYAKQDFNLTDFMSNLLPFMVFLWFGILSVPTVSIMNRIGRKNTVILSMGVTMIALLIPLVYYSFGMLLVVFSLLGIGNTLIQVAINPLVSDVVRNNRLTSCLTLGQFIKAISAFLGPLLVSLAAARFGNWKLIFLIYAAFTLASGAWLLLTPINEAKGNQKGSSIAGSFKLLSDNTILVFFLAIVVVVGIDVGLNTTIPKFLIERSGLELENAGLGTSLYFIARTLGTFLGSILLLKYTGRTLMFISIVCAIPVLMVLLFVGKLWIILSLIFLLGLAVANVFSIIFSAALDKKPNQVNEVSGLLIMGIAGGAIFPLLMGGISDLFGQTSGMAILLIPLLFLLFSTFYLKKEVSQ